MNKGNPSPEGKRRDDVPVELESQFILRLPATPATELRKAVQGGASNLKDRLSIQLETDMRHGTVRFDGWVYAAKLNDLPCVLESHKTIDRKTFYKTADISQILVCQEDDDTQTTEDEDSPKKKSDKKETKTDKKYQMPHGVTPPLKNVRKRRFRKTLKKKYVDAPEIEKEVKRLLRVDNEAVSVRWEVITDEEEGKKQGGEMLGGLPQSGEVHGQIGQNSQSLDIAEHDIFGEVLSSSDEENINIVDSADDDASRMSSVLYGQKQKQDSGSLMTQFTPGLLERQPYFSRMPARNPDDSYEARNGGDPEGERDLEGSLDGYMVYDRMNATATHLATMSITNPDVMDRSGLQDRLEDLRQQLLDIQSRRQAQQLEIAGIDNLALKQRFQGLLDNLIEEEREKQQQYDELAALFH